MSEAAMMTKDKQSPQTTYLKDYKIPAYFIDEVNLDFDLQDEFTIVKSRMHIRHNRLSAEESRQLILNGEELTLESIHLDGNPLPASQFKVTETALIVNAAPDMFELEIVTKIYPDKNTQLSGLYRSAGTYCTQCEPEGFRRITYFLDHPDVLSRFTTTIHADEKRYPYLLSNGNLLETGKAEGGRHWAKWEDPFKKPSYLFALVAGDFDLIEDKFNTQSDREIQLRIFVEKGYGDQAQHAMYSVKAAMRWDETAFGREYDLDVYMIVAIGDFNMGAMENKGLNIFNTKYVLAKPETATDDDYIHIMSVIGHEYFHNWSGNRVTCRDWFQLSLKEGLTIFRDQSFTEDTLSHAVMRIHDVSALRETQFPEDAGPLAHPVRPDSYIEINNFYTATVYNKGAEVLRMLQTILGKKQFRKGMDLYFARHDGHAVTIEDFVGVMEDISGIDLKQFRYWYSQAGTPVISALGVYDETQKTYQLTLSQTCPPTPGQPHKLPLHIPIRMGLLDQAGADMPLQLNNEAVESEKVLELREATQVFTFKNVSSRPIPSLLRNFSAPVKFNFPYTDSELAFLFKYDKDAFNRWEAGQQYALRVLLNLVNDYRQEKDLLLPEEFVDTYEYVLKHNHTDKFLLADMLLLPSEKYIGEQMETIDVDAIHAVREYALGELANELQALLVETYKENHESAPVYEFDMEKIGKRQLKNRCLAYLMMLPQFEHIGMGQFETALTANMTDAMAALSALANIDSSLRTQALDQFYATWKQDALVLDKWYSVQALSKLPTTLQEVQRLLQHETFDIKNPNKVYALVNAFGYRNMVNFHAKNGDGYRFIREVVQQLDKLNPQVAARTVKPLTSWKRYDKERQQLMRGELAILLQSKLSPDVYELVSKSLN